MALAVTGARLGTTTWKTWVAVNPPGSVAVAVTSVVPLATAVTVSALADGEVDTTVGSAAVAE